jgi:hypothetical protein
MKVGQTQFPKCRRVRPQFVGDNPIRKVSLLFQEFPYKFKGCALVPARLRKNFQDFTFIINGAPQICSLATYADKHFGKMPGTRRLNSA